MKRFAIVPLIMLAGCLSAPETPTYHKLDMTPAGLAAPKYNIDVDRLRPTEALARPQILIQAGATQVEYYAREEWVPGGIGELVPEKLETEFGPVREGVPTLKMTGTILGFEQTEVHDKPTARVKLDTSFHWEGQSRYDQAALAKVYEVNVPMEKANGVAVAVALSRGLEQIAEQIVADVNQLSPPPFQE